MFTVYNSQRQKKSRLSSSEQAELARVMAYVLTKFEENRGGKLRDGDIVDVGDNPFFMRCVAEQQGLTVYPLLDSSHVGVPGRGLFRRGG